MLIQEQKGEQDNMSWKDILKQKPDYPDLDGDGDKEEPMVDALKTIEEVESTKKSPDNNRVPIGAKHLATTNSTGQDEEAAKRTEENESELLAQMRARNKKARGELNE